MRTMIERWCGKTKDQKAPEVELGKQFRTTEWRVRNYSTELLRWGQKKGLKPDETALYLKLCHEFLAKEMGMQVNEVPK